MRHQPALDVQSFIEAFGGRQQVINRMRKRFSVDLSIKQVDKWIERDSIPGAYLVTLQIIGSEMDPAIEILDHVN